MAVLPQFSGGLSGSLTFESQPSLTWRINKNTNRIQGEADGLDAVRQAVEIILNVERFRWQIFKPSSGMQWRGLIGLDRGYAAAEVRRRMEEALKMDDRVTGIEDFNCTFSQNSLTVWVTVGTVYGSVSAETEVSLT